MNRFEPPAKSRPEAANFPSQTYTFSDSHALFKAPRAYPEPPSDMWYQVPGHKPKPAEQPKPIFPWEREPDRPKATRVFAEDIQPEPTPAVSSTHAFSTVHYQDDRRMAPSEAAGTGKSHSSKSADDQWQSYQQSSVNAWDTVPGIENYVRAIVDSQGRRGQTQTLQETTGTEDISSPLLDRRNRRESLILTDFPSAVERPSLPVTPAPLRRPSFWGDERNETGELPSATGVPDQREWVCPQCGFFSVNALEFQQRRNSFASATTAVVSPFPSTVSSLLPSVSSDEIDPRMPPNAAVMKETHFILASPDPASEETARSNTLSLPSISHARTGLNALGVPLPSWTSRDE